MCAEMSSAEDKSLAAPCLAKLDALPDAPGVYLMKGARNDVLYVGKAKNLRARVRSYFLPSGGDERAWAQVMVRHVHDLDYVVTHSEKEALILESNLIKQFKPRYNINLKDDKSFLSLRLDLSKPFPRLEIVRMRRGEDSLYYTSKERSKNELFRVKRTEKALYFGPYASAASVRDTVRFIHRVFPIRKCPDRSFYNRTRPCLYCAMNQCLGPCCGNTDAERYREMLQEVILFLRGQKTELVQELRRKMKEASAALDFERAARYRDQIAAIEHTIQKQSVTVESFVDRDVFALYREGDQVQVQAMFVRAGRLSDLASYQLKACGLPDAEFLSSFVKQFYVHDRFVPKEVVVPLESEDWPVLEEVLSERKGEKVSVIVPQRGERHALLKMAARNAENAFRARTVTVEQASEFLKTVQATLHLPRLPQRIECFDISNISGQSAVGSMVTFENGVANKKRYRHYRIRTVARSDDFAMMREVLLRRYTRAVQEDDAPDLTIVDGGKGQLGVAEGVLREAGLPDVAVIALAKARRHAAHGREQHVIDRVFAPSQSEPLTLPDDSPVLLFLGRIRDEAHRFAIRYHLKLRREDFLPKMLEGIPGLGPQRRRLLLKTFGNLAGVRAATVEQLAQVRGISEQLARSIFERLHEETQPPQGQGAAGFL